MSVKTAKYYIREDGDKYKVVGEDGHVFGTHDSKEKAREQQKALYANTHAGSRRRAANWGEDPDWRSGRGQRLVKRKSARELESPGEGIRAFKCEECGATVESYNGYDTDCGECGALYNAFGQQLDDGRPPAGSEDWSPSEWAEWRHDASKTAASGPVAVTDEQVSQFQNALERVGYNIDADEAHDILVLSGGYQAAMDQAGLRSDAFNNARPGESDDEIDTEGSYGLSELVETTGPDNFVYEFVEWRDEPGERARIAYIPEVAVPKVQAYVEALRQPEWKASLLKQLERFSRTARKTAMDFDFTEPGDSEKPVEFEMGDVSEVSEDIPEGINAELPADVAESIAEEPVAFQDGFTDGYNDEPNAQEEYEQGYEEGQEVLEDAAIPADEVLDTDSEVEDIDGDGEAEDLEEILSSLRSARNRFTSMLSSDRASEAEIRHAATMLDRTDRRIAAVEEKITEQQSEEYLAAVASSAPAADRLRHATVFVPHEEMVNIGEDDGSFLHVAARDVLSQVEDYDWKKFAQVGARQWVLEQPNTLLAHREVALEAAEDYAASKATMLANEAHRTKVVNAFVANVEQAIVNALTDDEPVEEEEDDPVQALAKAASVGDQREFGRIQAELHLNDDEAQELARIASIPRRADSFTWTDGDTTVDVLSDEGYSKVEVTTPAADEFGDDFIEPVFDGTSEDGLVEAPLDEVPLDAEFEEPLEELEEDEEFAFASKVSDDPIKQAAYEEVFGAKESANSYEYLTTFKNDWRHNRDAGPGYSDVNMQKVTDLVTERSNSQQEFIENLYYIADYYGLQDTVRDLEWVLEDDFGFDPNTDYNYTLTPEDEDMLYPGLDAQLPSAQL